MFRIRRHRQRGHPFYLVRELTDEEWGKSVRVDLWNGLVASIEGSDFVVLHENRASSLRIAGMVVTALGPDVEPRRDLAACGEWNTVSTPTTDYLRQYSRGLEPKTLIAVMPTGMFKQIGLKLRRSDRWVDIFETLIVRVDPSSETYSRVQLVHPPVNPITNLADRVTRGVQLTN